MKMVLNEAEVAKAVLRYAEAKMPVTAGYRIAVRMLWRGRSAVVEVVRNEPPLLTDAVGGPGAVASGDGLTDAVGGLGARATSNVVRS